jgi:hypothetical protein
MALKLEAVDGLKSAGYWFREAGCILDRRLTGG